MPSRRLLAQVVLALSVIVGPTSVLLLIPAPATAKAKTHYVSAPRASVARPILNEVFTISGSLGRGAPRVVALQRKVGKTWKIVTRKSVSKTGKYSFNVVQPATTVEWRVASKSVRYKGTTRKRRESRVLKVTRQAQTATVSAPQALNVGASVTPKVTVAPLRPGRNVAFQIDRGSGWQTVGTGVTNQASQATFPSQALPTVGTVRFRAVVAPARGAVQLVGTARTLYVMPSDRMLVAAHRGYITAFPENTLRAYEEALKGKADWLETDFQRSATDTEAELLNPACAPYLTGVAAQHWIALHDADFLRTTDVLTKFPPAAFPTKYVNGKPLVDRFTLCEIKRLDAGVRRGYPGQRVPTLTETLDLFNQYASSSARLLVEPKLGTAQEAIDLVDAIREYDDLQDDLNPSYEPLLPLGQGNHNDRAMFNTFSLPVAQALHDERPATEVAFIADTEAETGPEVAPFATGRFVKDSLITKARVDALHAAGKTVFAWTINKETRWYELAVLGVDVLVTDNSKLARTVLTGTG